jgi:cyclase
MTPRVIPCLLLLNKGLVKTVRFKDPKYLGDPINAVRIFNDKEVDELVFLDITATIDNRRPPFEYLRNIASECFMPLSYGGGIKSIEDIKTILGIGVEKVCINSYAIEDPTFIRQASDLFGSSSISVSIDVKKNLFGKYKVCTHGGRQITDLNPVQVANLSASMGAGEILLNSIDRDGKMQGYDLELIRSVSKSVDIPVIACGGAGDIVHCVDAVHLGGASAAAAGSMFVYYGRKKAVLINYPTPRQLAEAFAAD